MFRLDFKDAQEVIWGSTKAQSLSGSLEIANVNKAKLIFTESSPEESIYLGDFIDS